MSLATEIKKWRGEIKTDGYDMSIGELMSLYRDGELILRPKFQRFFRWTVEQKSKFIESILLGIPIPSIFVAVRESSVWEVIDGLQRLSTLFEFAGILKDAEEKLVPPLELTGTRYLPSLGGKVWGGEDSDEETSISPAERIDIKRAKISVKIIQKESQRFTKYELFQRLNTGAALTSDQEVRNCMLVDTNEKFYDWIEGLGNFEPFIDATSLSDKKIEEQYGLELVTRFLVFRNIPLDDLKNLGNIGEFIDERILAIAQDRKFDLKAEEAAFKDTFNLLASETGPNSFRKFDPKRGYTGGFLISAFEAIALGIGTNIERVKARKSFDVEQRVAKVWSNPEFIDWTGVGRTASVRLPHSIKIGRQIFKP